MSIYKEPFDWISEAIDSILNQTYKNFEFIIVNDNPENDRLNLFLKEYLSKDERIRLIKNIQNQGLTKSLNVAFKEAKGKYIVRMDADDISVPERLAVQYEYLESHPNVDVLGSKVKYIGITSKYKQSDDIKLSDEEIKAYFLLGNCIVHPSVMIRKECLDKNNIFYDENYRHSQDYRLWEQLKGYANFKNLNKILLHYRISEQQITKVNSTSQGNLSMSIRLRIQKDWLVKNGYDVSVEEIDRMPFQILKKIKCDSRINQTLEFKAFIQYIYIYHKDGFRHLLSFLLGDFRYFSYYNVARYLRKIVNSIK